MKKLLYISIAITGFLITSCASDKKDEPVPEATDAREKLVGYWSVVENTTSGQNTHTVNITKSTTNASEIIINNFSSLPVSVRASVSNNNLTIPFQQMGSLGFTKGSGVYNGSNSISLAYTNTISTTVDTCTATYTK